MNYETVKFLEKVIACEQGDRTAWASRCTRDHQRLVDLCRLGFVYQSGRSATGSHFKISGRGRDAIRKAKKRNESS